MSQQNIIKYVDIEWLKSNLHSFRILDFQPDVHDYIKEHIPGAVYLNENHFRYYYFNRPTEYVSSSVIDSVLSQAGVSNVAPVVVYGGQGRFSQHGDGLEQTMAAYSLARFGHKEIYILNGGIDAWIEAGLELEKKFPQIQTATFISHVQENFFVNYNHFLEIKNQPTTVLIDIRPQAIYEGISRIWEKPGHIPGAINIPWRQFMTHSNPQMLRPEHQLQELISSKHINSSSTIILYCGTGREATAAFIVFKYVLNYPNVQIYEGSFTEWCTYPENKTVTGPNPT